MFESLSAEQINDIQTETKRIKYEILNKTETIITADSLIEMTLCMYVTELKKLNFKVTDDIKNATRVCTIYSMNDKEFLDLKKRFNEDYKKIGEFYGVSESYPKLRYKLLLQKRRKLLESLDLDSAVDTLSEQIILKKQSK